MLLRRARRGEWNGICGLGSSATDFLVLPAPGGHKGPLRSHFVRDGERTKIVALADTPLPDQNLLPLEVPKGTLIVLHGLLPHGSAPNRSARSRHAVTLHVVDGRARCSPDTGCSARPTCRFGGVEGLSSYRQLLAAGRSAA